MFPRGEEGFHNDPGIPRKRGTAAKNQDVTAMEYGAYRLHTRDADYIMLLKAGYLGQVGHLAEGLCMCYKAHATMTGEKQNRTAVTKPAPIIRQ